MPACGPAADYAWKRNGYVAAVPVGYMPAIGVADVAEEHFGDIDGFLDFARNDRRGARGDKRGIRVDGRGGIEDYMADTQ